MAELRELGYAECRALLLRQRVGRAAVATPDGPQIIALNYWIVDDSIVIRTAPFSVLATYGRRSNLAFEVDHVRKDQQLGWSVVARGRANVITDPDELARIRLVCAPQPAGPRHLYLRLEGQELSGRVHGRAALLDLADEIGPSSSDDLLAQVGGGND